MVGSDSWATRNRKSNNSPREDTESPVGNWDLRWSIHGVKSAAVCSSKPTENLRKLHVTWRWRRGTACPTRWNSTRAYREMTRHSRADYNPSCCRRLYHDKGDLSRAPNRGPLIRKIRGPTPIRNKADVKNDVQYSSISLVSLTQALLQFLLAFV